MNGQEYETSLSDSEREAVNNLLKYLDSSEYQKDCFEYFLKISVIGETGCYAWQSIDPWRCLHTPTPPGDARENLYFAMKMIGEARYSFEEMESDETRPQVHRF
jgi:hypothetical protein